MLISGSNDKHKRPTTYDRNLTNTYYKNFVMPARRAEHNDVELQNGRPTHILVLQMRK